ncbi:CD1375 family protein [uncultured Exiguobacterium sp.]|nr:CD1375 family protein [uncultured Exiguobacterium sp.]
MYVLLVQDGRRTIEQVPERYRAEVETKLKQLEGGN